MTAQDKITKLRELMNSNSIDTFIIPNNDPHLSEYLPDRWKTRMWLSGFTGSAGTLVITNNSAGLWTDSRYFMQAEAQLKSTGICLYKMGVENTPDITDWIISNTQENGKISFEGDCLSTAFAESLSNLCLSKNIALAANETIINTIWTDRPDFPNGNIYELPIKYCGSNRSEKIDNIRTELIKNNAQAIILTALDDIAWTFNLRGSDIKYNPVFVSFAIITAMETVMFVDENKFNTDTLNTLKSDNISIQPYNEIYNYVSNSLLKTWIVNKEKINFQLFNSIPKNSTIINNKYIPALSKAIKNSTEISGMKNAHIKDGVALTKFFIWLEKTIQIRTISELEIADKLGEFRQEQHDYVGDSFAPIVGYKGNGAIIHYSATEESNATISKDGFLLIDSGGQYLDGTTDITRTIHLGVPSKTECLHYTLVLKGHINLAKANFLYGTRGSQLDILTRQPLWDNALNYGHGTGHGVGCFLNVHEGPQSIRQEDNPQIIEPGMITSNEPGLYIEGNYGIRLENLILASETKHSNFGKFMNFETITICHIDRTAILDEILLPSDIEWINDYHRKVYHLLSPHLNTEEAHWLKHKTADL